jgi:hypothetical protein
MADEKKKDTAAAPKNVRTWAPNKEKTKGQIIGATLDAFEAMKPEVRREVLKLLNSQYPGTRGESPPHPDDVIGTGPTYGA